MTVPHATDNAGDRQVGAHWEREFCKLAAGRGLVFTPFQIGRHSSAVAHVWRGGCWSHWTLPDIAVWSAPSEHHEIKHKSPNKHGRYGLEAYRLRPLVAFAQETRQPVLYTIHDWQMAGARSSRAPMRSRIEDWVTAEVLDLQNLVECGRAVRGTSKPSYVNGKSEERVPIWYWSADAFMPLADWWRIRTVPEFLGDFL